MERDNTTTATSGRRISIGRIPLVETQHCTVQRNFASPTTYSAAVLPVASFSLCFAPTFRATTHAPAAIAHEMKKAVQFRRDLGSATILGAQTRSVNTPIIAASAKAATRGKMPNRTPSPAAI